MEGRMIMPQDREEAVGGGLIPGGSLLRRTWLNDAGLSCKGVLCKDSKEDYRLGQAMQTQSRDKTSEATARTPR
jgi:hypothetical protein